VSQSSPATGTLTWTGTTLDWTVHVGVSHYEAEADTSPSFNSPAFRTVSNTYINSTNGNADTQWYLNDLYFGTTYYWRVRARNTVDTCTWSPTWSFTTSDAVSLTAPSDQLLSVSTAGTILNWAPHVGIAQYQAQWDTVNLFNTALLQSVNKTYINSTNGNSDTEHPTGAMLPQQIYFWRVRAINAVDTSAWTTRSFSTGNTPIVLPITPTLISPPNASIVTSLNVDLEWSQVAGAGGYEYMISTLPDLSNAIPLLTGGTSLSYGPMTVGTTYYWRVRSLQGGNASNWTPIWSFTYDPSTGLSQGPENSFQVYPNPTSDRITIRMPASEPAQLLLIDAAGRTVRTLTVSGVGGTMDLTGLPSGGYWLRMVTTAGIRSVAVMKH
jgi:hypothetical protein